MTQTDINSWKQQRPVNYSFASLEVTLHIYQCCKSSFLSSFFISQTPCSLLHPT